MKIKNVVIFFAIFLILLGAASIFFMPKENTVEAGMEERDIRAYGILAEEKNTIDVLVLGDSLCQSGISPLNMWEEQGITSYVCGQTAQRIWESYYMLKQVLKKQKPNVVVLETNLLFWPPDTEEEINESLFECAGYYFPVFQYHNRWKPMNPEVDEDGLDDKDYKGFNLKTDSVPYIAGEYMHETAAAKDVPRVERYFLRQMIMLCRSKGIEFVMVSLPSPKNYGYITHNAVTMLSGEYGVEFLDMNLITEEIEIDWNTDILDGSEHLNVFGAEKVSAYLSEYLVAQYDLTDYRKEERYQFWNECYTKYLQRLSDISLRSSVEEE